jgi:hypothetical protein
MTKLLHFKNSFLLRSPEKEFLAKTQRRNVAALGENFQNRRTLATCQL